jgi:secreted trypsin-like serine protease
MRLATLTLLSTLVLPACAVDDDLPPDVDVSSHEIVGGSVIQIKDAPWTVELRHHRRGPLCGGAILDEWNVLTARHCVHIARHPETFEAAASYEIIAGASTRSTFDTEGQVVQVADFLALNDLWDGNVGNDIVVVRLASPLRFNSKVKPIPMASPEDEASGTVGPGRTATVTGWGRTGTTEPGSEQLRRINLPIIPIEIAEALIEEQLPDDLLAAGGEPGKDTCFGDSGAPLTVKKHGKPIVAAVVSTGTVDECGAPGAPALYTRVAPYQDLIEQAMCLWPDVLKRKRNIAGTKDQLQFIKVEVPPGQHIVNFELSGGTGDADLFVRKGKKPTVDEFDCVSGLLASTSEMCHFFEPEAGTYYVGVIGNNDFSGATLRVNAYSH